MLSNCYSTSFTGTVVAKGYSDHHFYEFLRHDDFGLCLFLDGVLQSSESDQHIYHEKLVRAALEEQHSPSDVLIIGGAGGGALHQIRKAQGELRCRVTIVDIDEKLFCISRDLMRKWRNGELENPAVDVVFANGKDYLRETDREFDVIILDVSDPLPYTRSNDLFSTTVLNDIGRVLRVGGVVSFHTAPEHTMNHVFVTESLHGKCALRKISHLPTEIPSFEHAWMFNALKKQKL
jgi:spermidine synthase